MSRYTQPAFATSALITIGPARRARDGRHRRHRALSRRTHRHISQGTRAFAMKNAITIGASSGIGKELARVPSEHGYNVGLAARQLPMLTELEIGSFSGSETGNPCDYVDPTSTIHVGAALQQQTDEHVQRIENASDRARHLRNSCSRRMEHTHARATLCRTVCSGVAWQTSLRRALRRMPRD
jgi:hypothetical protein